MHNFDHASSITLGDCLGKGAFGAVYRGLNIKNGETVAVKRIKVSKIMKMDLSVIKMEIDLLKNLDHPNIVKYRGSYQFDDSLCIVLEYCENGSLHSICKNFGKIPENLVAIYTYQVLQGLHYLHNQGVIHRDIKGANILTTKDGTIKLADFGVATKMNALDEHSVVGSPYWMAPEVIELIGATTSSDIWSVGCTVIELLEGTPPYYDLDPTAALFHMVKDEHPPFPSNISLSAKNFLAQCFQKDPNLRIGTKKLLKHQWVTAHQASTKFTDAIDEVQKYNERVNEDNMNFINETTVHNINPTLHSDKQSSYHPPEPPKTPPPVETERCDVWDDEFQGTLKINNDVLKKSEHFLNFYKDFKSKNTSSSSTNSSPSKSKKSISVDQGSEVAELVQKRSSPEILTPALNRSIDLQQTPKHHRYLSSELKENVPDGLEKFVETKKDSEFTDVFPASSIKIQGLRKEKGLGTLLLNKSYNSWNDEDEETDDDNELFDHLDSEAESLDMENNILLDKRVRLISYLKEILKGLIEKKLEERSSLVTQIASILSEDISLKDELVKAHGMLPLIETLSEVEDMSLQLLLLKLINTIVYDNYSTLHRFCFSGGLSVVLKFSQRSYPWDFRYESAVFIQQMYRASSLSLQMFIGVSGLHILLSFLKEDYTKSKDLVFVGAEGLWKLLRQQDCIPRNDICRIVARSQVLEPMTKSMLKALAADDSSSRLCLSRFCEILLALSQSETYVKEALLSENIIRRNLRILLYLPIEEMVTMLQYVKQISMVPSSINLFRKVHLIPLLTHILGDPKLKDNRKEIRNESLATLFNICRLDKVSQEKAVISGAIPLLQETAVKDKILKEFALPILLTLPQCSPICRQYLWKNRGLEFFLSLLQDLNWQSAALDAISAWLQYEFKEIQHALLEKRYVHLILKVFCSAQSTSFNRLLDGISRICQLSPKLAASYGQPLVFQKLGDRLLHGKAKPITLLNAFQMVKCMCESNPYCKIYISQNDLPDLIHHQSRTSDSVLVRELAKDLLKQVKGSYIQGNPSFLKPDMPPPKQSSKAAVNR
ncbi:STE/STE11/CDC15 protein kinase Cdc7 [Schizosaccharomyces octosporus yFS286]|uniref:non-specific serine/threonine protein kinase n=1 Tax=Schizosaccharomyces octosporus (strain yFS286) TaxID=483514 RepID=S9PTA5_SCHOY|nr:STE/STE11/CDC15 protein kinase Cdc7 [Schizosaccharomyces octosporus yFS286]EPX72381.1 STE/STE11/CDC15 protein kinase Cdc7 [Schizosaccharomyces octosporus yFS286]